MSGRRRSAPPLLARAILSVLAGRLDRSFLLGDLAEEFRLLANEEGRHAASRWYWNQTVRSAGPLLMARLDSRRAAGPVGASVFGVVAAVASATLFGITLSLILDGRSEPNLSTITVVVTACAMVSSACGGWASTWVSGAPSRWVLVLIGAVVVAPDIIHFVRYPTAFDPPWAILPPALAVVAAGAGLTLGGRICRRVHFHP